MAGDRLPHKRGELAYPVGGEAVGIPVARGGNRGSLGVRMLIGCLSYSFHDVNFLPTAVFLFFLAYSGGVFADFCVACGGGTCGSG